MNDNMSSQMRGDSVDELCLWMQMLNNLKAASEKNTADTSDQTYIQALGVTDAFLCEG